MADAYVVPDLLRGLASSMCAVKCTETSALSKHADPVGSWGAAVSLAALGPFGLFNCAGCALHGQIEDVVKQCTLL